MAGLHQESLALARTWSHTYFGCIAGGHGVYGDEPHVLVVVSIVSSLVQKPSMGTCGEKQIRAHSTPRKEKKKTVRYTRARRYINLSEVAMVCSLFAQADEACSACYDGALVDGTCDPTKAVDCGGYADYFCCSVGGACRHNELLLGWLSKWLSTVRCILVWAGIFGSNILLEM